MSSNDDKSSEKNNRIRNHINDETRKLLQELHDDQEFCESDIQASIEYVTKIRDKFNEKCKEFLEELKKLSAENKNLTNKNRTQFDEKTLEIDRLCDLNKHEEALTKFNEYKKSFGQRETLNGKIPKLHIHELDIEKYFSTEKINQTQTQSTIVTNVSTPQAKTETINNNNQSDNDPTDLDDISLMTDKRRSRQGKKIDEVKKTKEDVNAAEINDRAQERNNNSSDFGSRSMALKSQTTEVNNPPTNTYQSSISNSPTSSNSQVTLQLQENSKIQPLLGRGRGSRWRSTNQLPNVELNNMQNQFQVIREDDDRINQPQAKSREIVLLEELTQNPAIQYKHEPKKFILMACNRKKIVIFKIQTSTSWRLDYFERNDHNETVLQWDNGLIISMGFIGDDRLFIFTEYQMYIYSVRKSGMVISRILPHGNDNESEMTDKLPYNAQRGIGAYFDLHIYHVFKNRSLRWTLTTYNQEELTDLGKIDLTILFPEVERIIHFCVNENTMNFLVQMEDSSYAVVFCSTHKMEISDSYQRIILEKARAPLTICSAHFSKKKKFIFFINDPSAKTLHIVNYEKYLYGYPTVAYAIYYVSINQELMVVRENSIDSMKLESLENS